jgi:hypothetical protein
MPGEGATFDGWVGLEQIVEASTITSDEWAYICAPQGRPSELYNLKEDPDQEHNVLDQHTAVARGMRQAWTEFLESHGAPQSRIRPFMEANVDTHTPVTRKFYAFRDDLGQWIAASSEGAAQALAYRDDAPGPVHEIEEITFEALLDDNPKNLVHLFGQYYWAQDLA